MNTATTSRRWVTRIATTAAVAGAVAGLEAAPAMAAPPQPAPIQVPMQVPMQEADPDRSASVRTPWQSRGRPHRMAIVWPDRIDLVTEGRLTRQIWHGTGPVTAADLDRALPADWLTINDGTVVLDAAVVLVRDTVLQLGGPDGVHTLQLVGGSTPAEAASLHTSGSRSAGLAAATAVRRQETQSREDRA